MFGVSIKLCRIGEFYHPAQVHHGHTIADILDHPQVVCDKKKCQVEFLLEILEKVEDLGLDRHIEGAHRLIGDDEFGANGERPRYPDPLPLSPGELMGVTVHVFVRDAHPIEQLRHPQFYRVSPGQFMDLDRFTYHAPHREPRVERPVRILKNDLHPFAELSELSTPQRQHLDTVEQDLARGRLDQSQDRTRQRGFTTSRLADKPQYLPPSDAKADPVDGFDMPGYA
jgi:hypothetical protein